jgi:hypothetical protein
VATADSPAAGPAALAAERASSADALTTEGQRRINLIWERTQAIIAIAVVLSVLAVVAAVILIPIIRGQPLGAEGTTGLVLLATLVGNVTTSYFTRTNHTKVGGVGPGDQGR